MTLSGFALYLGQTSFAVSILIGLVLLARRPFAKAFGAKAAYALWLIPLLRLVMPPLPSQWTLLGWLQAFAPTPENAPSLDSTIIPEGFFLPGIDAPHVTQAQPVTIIEILMMHAGLCMLALWAIGALIALSLLLAQQARSQRRINSHTRTPSPAVSALAEQMEKTLGLQDHKIRIKINIENGGPCVTGLYHPIILLPEWFAQSYTPAEQKNALAHEMMHIKRGDLWTLCIANIAFTLQWFNPLAWYAMKAFRADQEAACDADVLALGQTSPHAYGQTLIKTARIFHAGKNTCNNTGFAPVHATRLSLNHALHERLTTMKNPLPSTRTRKTATLLTATVGAAALLASACATSTAQEADVEKTVETIITQTQAESIIIKRDDGETKIVINGKELTPEEAKDYVDENGNTIQTFRIEQGEDITALKGARAVFIGDGESTRPDATEFANEMRRLAQNPAANASAMTALADDFQARMTAWSDKRLEHIDLIESNIEQGTFTWHTDGIDSECGNQAQIRTVIVEKDDESGEQSRIENIECGTIEGIDADALITQLRANSELTEERLAEVRERLESLELGRAGQKRVRVEIDTETSND